MSKYSLIYLFILAVLVRFLFLSQQSVFFYFDQARDAVVSRSIIEQKDVKIQGPSVSGTNDSVYHGVFYYYLIAPLYTLSQGSPIFVAYALAMIGALAVFVIYYLGREVFDSSAVGLLAALFLACSSISVQQHVWLSNPQLSSLFLPLAYLYLWRIFFSTKKVKLVEYIIFAVLLALNVQVALQSIVILGSVVVASLYKMLKNKTVKIFSGREFFLMLSIFVVGISSMLTTELLMWRRGILNLITLNLSDHQVSLTEAISKIAIKYWEVIKIALVPQASWLLLVFGLIIILALKKLSKSQLLWSGCFIFAPVWLLLWHYRDPFHTFIGVEIVLYLLLAKGLLELAKYSLNLKKISYFVAAVFVLVQLSYLHQAYLKRSNYYGIQKGAFLNEELALIKQTYLTAGDRQFTFSTLTSPYAINTTWSYLYAWYGTKIGQKPVYIGMPQQGYPGEGLLPETTIATAYHFSIIEPDTTLSLEKMAEFFEEQTILAGPIIQEWEFGTLKLQLRQKN